MIPSAVHPSLLRARHVTKVYRGGHGCRNVSLEVRSGEILGIVGESGSGKSTLLSCLAGRKEVDRGSIVYRSEKFGPIDMAPGADDRIAQLHQSEIGYIHQNPRDGLRMSVTAGGNIAERIIVDGNRCYFDIRERATEWLCRVEIPEGRLDDLPAEFSGGMLQRLQIARNLISGPRILFMDEPTGGLDVSVQARLLDLLRGLVRQSGIAAIIVTHDLAVARLLADRLMVMQRGLVIEEGLTDQVLDDPHHPYTQLLVSSVLQA
ncbi:phosphonate C-P lyase system protein PhnK [Labrys wisconsinensis]|uniref:Phosphonate transport system ATP-binding protein n=1 Tax=Labrys wisconsinensis TaxID=425677 RepID=A0ABU0JG81_9HYPH|nr:phosphonate C-P lyase system protein PhnK [Labrys wisconsinensis]MDQ0473306.1 putative phosphonate transport system ATP-binding protein [Labrys wisconsinensis]